MQNQVITLLVQFSKQGIIDIYSPVITSLHDIQSHNSMLSLFTKILAEVIPGL